MDDIQVVDAGAPNKDMMMLKVIESGNIEALEKFINLREREESRQAAIVFDEKFSAMQAEFVPVTRDKKGYGYQYAPIETLQRQYMPIISKHGFSCTWTEEALPTGKRCIMRISGHGSSRYNSFDIPELGTNKQMNAVQAAGAMSTYGRRYSFIAGFGVIIDDEDDDADTNKTSEDYADAIASINACKSTDELISVWKGLYAKHSADTYAIKVLSSAKDAMKAKLS